MRSIAYAAELGVTARGSRDAPGVYVGDAKLASVGLRIRRGSSYHGMALNVSLDLEPFGGSTCAAIRDLTSTRLCDLCAVRDAGSGRRRARSALAAADGFRAARARSALTAPSTPLCRR